MLGPETYNYYFDVRGEINLANSLGIQLLAQDNYYCTLESACPGPADCDFCGSRTTLGTDIYATNAIYRSTWGYVLLQAFSVLNQQLENNYKALQGAAINGALQAFSINDFYPHSDATFELKGVLAGLTLGLAVFSAVVPVFAEGAKILEGAGEILGEVSTYLGEGLGESKDPLATQKTFASSVSNIYNGLVAQLDTLGNQLLAGKPIGSKSIVDVVANGTWATSLQLTNITLLEKNLRTEIFARSVNSLWKTFSSNKMWLTFSLLSGSGSCESDRNGPQDMKLCQVGLLLHGSVTHS